MNRFKSSVIAGTSLVVLAAIGTIMNSGHSNAQPGMGSAPVTVTNTTSNPVPTTGTATVSGTVKVSGLTDITGSVGINNTPTVNVGMMPAISGNVGVSGTVGISGTPTVNVGALPAISGNVGISGTPSVNIASVTNPIPVQDAASAAKPFQLKAVFTIPDGQVDAPSLLIPSSGSDKLHVEYASVICTNLAQGHSVQVDFLTHLGGTTAGQDLPLLTVPAGTIQEVATGQQVSWYADAGVDVYFLRDYNNNGGLTTTCLVTITGRQASF